MTDIRIFPSRIDLWLAAIMVTAGLGMAVAGFAVLAATPGPFAVVYVTLMLASSALMLWTMVRTRYTFAADRLEVRSGPFRWRLAVADIVRASPTRNPAAGPAMSLDRLALTFKDGRVMGVSPRDKDGFLAELAARQAKS